MFQLLPGLFVPILAIHNVLRWILVISAVYAIFGAFVGWFGKKPWGKAADIAGIFFTSMMDLQVLVGLILYFFSSPIVNIAGQNFGAAMQNSNVRFYAVEHILIMILAMGVAHVGRAASHKAVDPSVKYKRAAIWFTISVILVLAAIPWARPLLPLYIF